MARLAIVTPETTTIQEARSGWLRRLKAEGKSPNTVATYGYGLQSLETFLTAQGHSGRVQDLTRGALEEWLIQLREERQPWTVNGYFRGVRSFLDYLVEEDEISQSPARSMTVPTTKGTKPRATVRQDDVETLWTWIKKASRAKPPAGGAQFAAYRERRDAAILAVLISSGGRLSEVQSLTLDQVEQNVARARVKVKGGDWGTLRWDERTADALAGYLKWRRAYHPEATALWLGRGGVPMSPSGIRQVVAKRGRALGLAHLHPHRLRHAYVDDWFRKGGSAEGLSQIVHWKGTRMASHYSADLAEERAEEEARRLGKI